MLLTTERLVVRRLQPDDLDDFYTYRSHPEVTRYQGFDVMSVEESRTFIDNQLDVEFGKPGQWVQFAIAEKSTDQLVGDCAIKLFESDKRIAEIGITLSHLKQKNGYAREVILEIMQFLFEKQGVRRIQEIVDVQNKAAIRLLEHTGFRREGHFVENIYFKGAWGSEYQYAMLRKEWKKLHQRR